MNDLTKEARARAYEAAMNRGQQMTNEALQNLGMSSAHYGNALANAMAGPKYGDKSLNPDRPLTGKPKHYLTGDEGSRCDRLDVPEKEIRQSSDYSHLPILDLDEFRKFCEEIGE